MTNTKTALTNKNVLSVADDAHRWVTINANGELITNPEELAAVNQGKTVAHFGDNGSNNTYIHSWAIEDASYLKLSNITLGYTFPKNVINKIGLTKLRLGIGQLSSIQYFRTIAVSKEDAQVKILPTESIVDTAIEIRQGITNNGLITFSNLVVFTTVHVLKFPVTWLDILLVAMIRYTVLQCISFGCSIVIEVFHLIQSVSHITVELSQWLIYSNLMGCPRTTITKVGQIQLYIFTCQFLNLVLVVGESNRSVPCKIFGYDVCRIIVKSTPEF